LNIYLCTISSTCFGLTRPSSGAMDVIIYLHIKAYGVLGVVRCWSWAVCVLVACCTAITIFINSAVTNKRRRM